MPLETVATHVAPRCWCVARPAVARRDGTGANRRGRRRRGGWCCICTPLGLHPPHFFPEKAGKDYALTPYLEVLKEFRDDFTVISGLSHPDVEVEPRLELQLPHRRAAPGAAGRLPEHDLARSVRGRAASAARRGSPACRCRARGSACRGRAAGRSVPTDVLAVERVRQAVHRRPARRGRGPGHAGSRTGRAFSTRCASRRRRCSPASAPATATSSTSTSPASANWSSGWRKAEEWAKKPKPKVDAKPPQDITNSADLIGRTRLLFDLIHLALQTDSTRLVTHPCSAARAACRRFRACRSATTTCRTTARTRPRSSSSRTSKWRR